MLQKEDKLKILRSLGYPAQTIIEGSTQYHSVISDRLSLTDSTIEYLVLGLLSEIEAVNKKLISAQDLMKTKRVDSIEINENESRLLTKDKSRLCKELAVMLDIPYRGKKGSVRVIY